MTDGAIPATEIRPALVCVYLLDGNGRGEPLDSAAIDAWSPEKGILWTHLDCAANGAAPWLRDRMGLDPLAIEGLLADETRPRCSPYGEGVLLILRGVNLNAGADPEDMVSIRLWIDDRKVISTRLRPLMAVQDVRGQLEQGVGAISSGHLAARIANRLTVRMGPVIEDLSDRISEIEDTVDSSLGDTALDLREIRRPLLERRRTTIALRRYLAPQRDAIIALSNLDVDWLDQRSRARLRETADAVIRLTEELDEIRERSFIIQDEMTNRISHRMEKTMYVLTIVATVMLPLGFLTGLLGINVGGMPGAESELAFWLVTFGLAAVAAIEVWLFRRLGWL